MFFEVTVIVGVEAKDAGKASDIVGRELVHKTPSPFAWVDVILPAHPTLAVQKEKGGNDVRRTGAH